nr:uncharacterized protein LOC127329087 [Lolium perenne]
MGEKWKEGEATLLSALALSAPRAHLPGPHHLQLSPVRHRRQPNRRGHGEVKHRYSPRSSAPSRRRRPRASSRQLLLHLMLLAPAGSARGCGGRGSRGGDWPRVSRGEKWDWGLGERMGSAIGWAADPYAHDDMPDRSCLSRSDRRVDLNNGGSHKQPQPVVPCRPHGQGRAAENLHVPEPPLRPPSAAAEQTPQVDSSLASGSQPAPRPPEKRRRRAAFHPPRHTSTMAGRWHNRRDAAKLGPPLRDRRAEAPTCSMDLHATTASRHRPAANHPRAVQTPQTARRRRAPGAAAPASPTPAESMPAPGTPSASTRHEQQRSPVWARQGPETARPGQTGARPAAVAPSSTPTAARSFARRRRATVAARGGHQQLPAAARPADKSSLRAQGSAAGPPSRGCRPGVRARSGHADPSQPRSSRRRGPEDAAAEPSACPRAATRDELPAAAHSRTSFARRSAPAAAKGRGGGGGGGEPGG